MAAQLGKTVLVAVEMHAVLVFLRHALTTTMPAMLSGTPMDCTTARPSLLCLMLGRRGMQMDVRMGKLFGEHMIDEETCFGNAP